VARRRRRDKERRKLLYAVFLCPGGYIDMDYRQSEFEAGMKDTRHSTGHRKRKFGERRKKSVNKGTRDGDRHGAVARQDWHIPSIGGYFEAQFFGGGDFGGRKSAKKENVRKALLFLVLIVVAWSHGHF
jgi:hypothetical protein